MRQVFGLTVLLALAGICWGQAFYYQGYLTELPHSYISFETNGNNQPVVVTNGSSKPLPAAEYASRGFTFSKDLRWVNDSGTDFDAAQAIGGSPQIAIPGSGAEYNDFYINFSGAVRSFGFWVVDNNSVAGIVTFTVWGARGILSTVSFAGLAIDNHVGIADYGFLGFNANENIVSVRVQKQSALLDSFRFSLYNTVLPQPDIDESGCVDLKDFAIMANRWMSGDCGFCDGADLNTDHMVNVLDLVLLSDNWLEVVAVLKDSQPG